MEAKAESLLLLLLSPDKAHISDEFQVQSDVFCLAPAGLKRSVHGSSYSSFGHNQAVALHVQYTLRSRNKDTMKTTLPALQAHASL